MMMQIIQHQTEDDLLKKGQTSITKYIPRGCFQTSQIDKFSRIKDFMLLSDMYKVVTPFEFYNMGFVIAKKNTKKDGKVLELYHEASRKLILKAVSKSGQIGSKYVVTHAQTEQVVSRIRGDLMGNRFHIFDGGNNPSRQKFPSRKQLAYVYSNNFDVFSQKPAKVTVTLPPNKKRPSEETEETKTEGMRLKTLYEVDGVVQVDQNYSQLLKHNQRLEISSVQPVFCSYKKGYILDLKGLVTQASKLNIVFKSSNQNQCLFMGKRSENTFSMFLGSPLSLVQAFGIFITNYIARGS